MSSKRKILPSVGESEGQMHLNAAVSKELNALAEGMPPIRVGAEPPPREAEIATATGESVSDAGGEEGVVLSLGVNDLLFSEGQPKTHIYVVKSGVLGIYEPRWNGHHAAVEFAFPGDVIGLGFLDKHICHARATLDATVLCLPLSSLNRVIADDPKAQAWLSEAIEQEFDYLRETSIQAGEGKPVERLAAFLLALARENVLEGRDPTVLSPSPNCRTVAELLRFDLDELAAHLIELERRGLIKPGRAQEIYITDFAALERLANAKGSFEQTGPPALDQRSVSA